MPKHIVGPYKDVMHAIDPLLAPDVKKEAAAVDNDLVLRDLDCTPFYANGRDSITHYVNYWTVKPVKDYLQGDIDAALFHRRLTDYDRAHFFKNNRSATKYPAPTRFSFAYKNDDGAYCGLCVSHGSQSSEWLVTQVRYDERGEGTIQVLCSDQLAQSINVSSNEAVYDPLGANSIPELGDLSEESSVFEAVTIFLNSKDVGVFLEHQGPLFRANSDLQEDVLKRLEEALKLHSSSAKIISLEKEIKGVETRIQHCTEVLSNEEQRVASAQKVTVDTNTLEGRRKKLPPRDNRSFFNRNYQSITRGLFVSAVLVGLAVGVFFNPLTTLVAAVSIGLSVAGIAVVGLITAVNIVTTERRHTKVEKAHAALDAEFETLKPSRPLSANEEYQIKFAQTHLKPDAANLPILKQQLAAAKKDQPTTADTIRDLVGVRRSEAQAPSRADEISSPAPSPK